MIILHNDNSRQQIKFDDRQNNIDNHVVNNKYLLAQTENTNNIKNMYLLIIQYNMIMYQKNKTEKQQ